VKAEKLATDLLKDKKFNNVNAATDVRPTARVLADAAAV